MTEQFDAAKKAAAKQALAGGEWQISQSGIWPATIRQALKQFRLVLAELDHRDAVEIEKLTAQHSLDAETVCKVHGEYEELEAKLRAAEVELAKYRQHHSAIETVGKGPLRID